MMLLATLLGADGGGQLTRSDLMVQEIADRFPGENVLVVTHGEVCCLSKLTNLHSVCLEP